MMTFDEAWSSTTGNGWLTKDEARLLWDTALPLTKAILEVGSYQGKSTCLLARLGRPVYAVDPFDGFTADHTGDAVRDILLKNLRDRDICNVTVFRQRIEDWKSLTCDFAYLDGDHTYEGTKSQILVALQAGVRTFCVHDYEDSGGGLEVQRAVKTVGLKVTQRVERMAVCEFKIK